MDNRWKVVGAFVIVAVFGYCLALAAVSYLRETELNEYLEMSVESDLRFRLAELETYRDAIQADINLVAGLNLTRTAVAELSDAFDALGADPKSAIQKIYIEDNPYPLGSRDSLMRANDGSRYSRIHGTYHGWLRAIVGARDFYDLLLVRHDGTIIYSVAKQENLGANLRSDGESSPVLGPLFDTIIKAQPETLHTTPFQQVGGGLISQYIGMPIFADGQAIGALILQLSVDRISGIVRDQRMGQSNLMTYIATPDGRNLIRPGTQPSDLVRLAANGAAGTRRTVGIDGHDVFAGFAPVRWIGSQMVLITEYDMKIADKRKWLGAPFLTLVGAILVAIAALGGWMLGARDRD